MTTSPSSQEIQKIAEEGKAFYSRKKYSSAIEKFQAARDQYQAIGDKVNAAEMANNISVCLVMTKDPQGALEAALGTDLVFESVGDKLRLALALGNQASAYEDLHQPEKALSLYEKSSDLLEEIGDRENRAIVLKRISSIQLQHGKQLQAIASMNTALQVEPSPSSKEKSLKKVLNKFFSAIRPK